MLCLLLATTGCQTTSPTGTEQAPDAEAFPPNQVAPGVPPNDTEAQGIKTEIISPTISEHRPPLPGTIVPRCGDEIVVAGQFVHTGAPVVLWLDPGGYDAYRAERRFSPPDEASWQATQEAGAGFDSPNRYDQRGERLTAAEREHVRGGGWDLPALQRCVNQIVMHYDVAGTSRQCFKVLHDVRDLSVHFMVDLDGTIYQTLDVKERARHANGANDRSVGIEIANIGAYPPSATGPLDEWYQGEANGKTRVTLPARFGDGGLRTANFSARPARMKAITNVIQGMTLVQYDFTLEQYRALSHLVAALCKVLPEIRCDAPRDASGNVTTEKLADATLADYRGVLGHYHITTRKIDPGPAFQWNKVLGDAQRLMRGSGQEQTAQSR